MANKTEQEMEVLVKKSIDRNIDALREMSAIGIVKGCTCPACNAALKEYK